VRVGFCVYKPPENIVCCILNATAGYMQLASGFGGKLTELKTIECLQSLRNQL
jgi:hypothetical protein